MLFTIAQYAAALVTIGTAFALTVKWVVIKPIKAYIDHATYPISPGANGGLSLADANKTLKRIETKIDDIDDRLVQVENLVTKPTRQKKSTTK